jgi:hypothetical protein
MRPKIVYILGSGRCGSTLLNCVLGQAEGVVAPGEIGLIWERLVTRSHVCDCGTPFDACPFWRAVLRNGLPTGKKLASEKELNRLHWKLTGSRSGLRFFFQRPPRRLNRGQRQYLDVLIEIYREISRLSGCPIVVDSSKRPLHAWLLTADPSLDVRCIHLVRDSRAVVHSQLARTKRSLRWLAARWLIVNLLCEAVVRKEKSHLRLRYEDFCASPQSSLAAIASFADLSLETVRLSPEGSVNLEPAHGVGGDEVRFRKGEVRISANERWRTQMPARARRVVTRLTYPLLVRYGYAGRAKPGQGK